MKKDTDVVGRGSAHVDDTALPGRTTAATGEVDDITNKLTNTDGYTGQGIGQLLDRGFGAILPADIPWHIALRARFSRVIIRDAELGDSYVSHLDRVHLELGRVPSIQQHPISAALGHSVSNPGGDAGAGPGKGIESWAELIQVGERCGLGNLLPEDGNGRKAELQRSHEASGEEHGEGAATEEQEKVCDQDEESVVRLEELIKRASAGEIITTTTASMVYLYCCVPLRNHSHDAKTSSHSSLGFHRMHPIATLATKSMSKRVTRGSPVQNGEW